MLFRSSVFASASSLALLLLSMPAVGQDRNSIMGFVFTDSRTPVSRAYVELQNDLYSTIARTQTNGSGMFSFIGLPSGQYVVKVLTAGTDFEEQSRSVSLVPISALPGRGVITEQVDLYLKARKRPGSQGLGAAEVLFVQEIPPQAKTLYQSGVTELDRKNEQVGYSRLKQALEIFPEYYLALDRLGNEYLAKGYYTAAHVLFTNAVKVNSRSVSSTLGLGVAEYRLNKVEVAEQRFSKVVELDKGNAFAHYWLGISLHAAKKLEAAVDALSKAERLSDGGLPDVYWQLARVYKDQSKFKESANSLEKYLKAKPDAENAEEIKRFIKLLREKNRSASA